MPDAAKWIIFVLLAAPLLMSAIYWAAILWHTRSSAAGLPVLDDAKDAGEPAGGWPSVSIVVPMHNEQAIADKCIRSLRELDYPNLQIIVACDRCTDDTDQIADDHAAQDDRVKIVHVLEAREDWIGKTNPMHVGSQEATGDWGLFIDADVQMSPTILKAAVIKALDRNCDLLTILPQLRYEKPWEFEAQAPAGFVLMQWFQPMKVNDPKSKRAFATGQFMMIKRELFERMGRISTFGNLFQEDMWMARTARRHGGSIYLVSGGGQLHCQMYETQDAFDEGWKRIYIGVVDRRVSRLKKAGMFRYFHGAAVPLLRLIALAVSLMMPALAVLVIANWLLERIAVNRLYKISGAPPQARAQFHRGCRRMGRILFTAARDLENRTPIRWAGREYVLEPR